MNELAEFYTDQDIARVLRMSTSWVRGQRFKRRHGLPCQLDIEPRYIGSCARYLKRDVEAFVAKIAA